MSVNIGSAVAYLSLDTTGYTKGMTSAMTQMGDFKRNNDALASSMKRMEQTMVADDWGAALKIEGYTQLRELYAVTADEKLRLDAKIHKEEKKLQQEMYNSELKRIKSMNTGNSSTTDYAAIINDYGSLKTALEARNKEILAIYGEAGKGAQEYIDNEEEMLSLDKRIIESSEDRKDKLLEAKKQETDGILQENRRIFESQKNLDGYVTEGGQTLNRGDSYEIDYLEKQISANREMINYLQGQDEALTKSQQDELDKRLKAEDEYYADIENLTTKAMMDKQEAEGKIVLLEKETKAKKLEINADYGAQAKETEEEFLKDKEAALASYEKSVQKVNSNLMEQEKRITEAYERELKQRQEAVFDFTGLFQEVNHENISGDKLLSNLGDQVSTMEAWEASLRELAGKGINEDLLNELITMGPDGADEVAALNTLSEDQLEEYTRLYEQKRALANEIARKQMEEEAAFMKQQLRDAQNQAQKQLEELSLMYMEKMEAINAVRAENISAINKAWAKSIEEVNKGFSEGMAELGQIIKETQEAISNGNNALDGGENNDGIESTKSASETKKNIYKDENTSFALGEEEKTKKNDFENKEQVRNTLAINTKKSNMYKDDETKQGKLEAKKTANVKKENNAQEADVRETQEDIIDDLEDFVPAWASIGQEYGNVFLEGIKSTKDEIHSYLTQVAIAVQAASKGAAPSQFAKGTNNAPRGLAVVGEKGPEIVDFSGGEKVMTFRNSVDLLGQAMDKITRGIRVLESDTMANTHFMPVNKDNIDYDKLAQAVAKGVKEKDGAVLNYNPVYNSPKAMTVNELKKQDKIAMRRLGWGF